MRAAQWIATLKESQMGIRLNTRDQHVYCCVHVKNSSLPYQNTSHFSEDSSLRNQAAASQHMIYLNGRHHRLVLKMKQTPKAAIVDWLMTSMQASSWATVGNDVRGIMNDGL